MNIISPLYPISLAINFESFFIEMISRVPTFINGNLFLNIFFKLLFGTIKHLYIASAKSSECTNSLKGLPEPKS